MSSQREYIFLHTLWSLFHNFSYNSLMVVQKGTETCR